MPTHDTFIYLGNTFDNHLVFLYLCVFKMRQGRIRYIISVCLLALYTVFQLGITVFPHEHILNGEKLVHSHPYSNANHSHSSDQAVAIARLSSVQALKAETSISQAIERPMLYALELNTYSIILKAPHTHCVSLRAPPFC